MTDFRLIFGAAAAVISVVQYLPYLWDVFYGRTRPHAFTWFVWGVPTGLVFLAQVFDGAGEGAWATGLTALMCTGIFVLALFRGEKKIVFLDWASLAGALFATVVWIYTEDPLSAVIIGTAIDLIGFVPTVRKSVLKPYEETLSTYVIGGLKWGLALAALEALDPVTLTYPAAMMFANFAFAAMLVERRLHRLGAPTRRAPWADGD